MSTRAEVASVCLAEHTVLEFLEGRLDGTSLRAVDEHLDSCESCRQLVAIAAQFRSTVAAAPSRVRLLEASETPLVLAALRNVAEDDYHVEGELARGGMGRILLAVDRHGRRVAIKVLIDPSANAINRFVREMQVTARLQHPSIITLHEAGRWSSGEPFFAMKLVEGRSLREELAVCRNLPDRLALLPRLIAVTDALAYAHDRHVIHRDIKPGNVIVGAFGETVVIDWGLAKLSGSGPAPAPAHESGDRLSGDALTQTGAVLGTPAYMSPEQARGEPVDARTDVYSLGAVLYHLLAGCAPYESSGGRALLNHVMGRAPTPLERLQPDAPPELVAITTKSMQRSPTDRYATAREMAADIQSFIAGRLVSAHVYTPSALLRRWLGRYRPLVIAAVTFLGLFLVTASVSVARVVHERDRAEMSRQAATEQRSAAEALVDYLIVEFRRRVETAERLDLLVGLGEKVAAYYQRSDPAIVADPDALERRAGALEALGLVEQDKHNGDKALDLYHAAVQLRLRANALRPATSSELVAQSLLWHNIGVIDVGSGHFDAGMDDFRQALATGEQAIARDPSYVPGHVRAARAEERMAEALQLRKLDNEGALVYALKARDRLAPLLVTNPTRGDLLTRVGSLEGEIGLLELDLGHLDQAFLSVRGSIEHYAHAIELDSSNGGYQRGYAIAFLRMSRVELARRRVVEAEAALRSHLAREEPIARADSENLATQRDLAFGYVHACDLERSAHHLEEAAHACQQSEIICQRQFDHDPKNQDTRSTLLEVRVQSARVEALRGRTAAAQVALGNALELGRGLAREEPETPEWESDIAHVLQYLAPLEVDSSPDTAAEHAREGLEHIERLAARAPALVKWSEMRTALKQVLGEVELRRGHADVALALYNALERQLEEDLQRWPEWIPFRVQQAETRLQFAAASDAVGRPLAREPRTLALRALDELRANDRAFPEDELLHKRAQRELLRN